MAVGDALGKVVPVGDKVGEGLGVLKEPVQKVVAAESGQLSEDRGVGTSWSGRFATGAPGK